MDERLLFVVGATPITFRRRFGRARIAVQVRDAQLADQVGLLGFQFAQAGPQRVAPGTILDRVHDPLEPATDIGQPSLVRIALPMAIALGLAGRLTL